MAKQCLPLDFPCARGEQSQSMIKRMKKKDQSDFSFPLNSFLDMKSCFAHPIRLLEPDRRHRRLVLAHRRRLVDSLPPMKPHHPPLGRFLC